MRTLPIVVAARNEEQSVRKALDSFSRAAERFIRKNPEMRVCVVVCNNGSEDRTASVVLESAKVLNRANFEILLINEPRRGKINALRTAIIHLNGPAVSADAIIFADADTEWEPETLNELWDYWRNSRGAAKLVGANVVRRKQGCPNVWEILERVPYAGYGDGPQGHGLFCRFASGMTYLAEPGVLKLFWRMPASIDNEDLALSYLVGPRRVWVCPTAIVKYAVADRWCDFKLIRGRHIAGCRQLTEWVARRLYDRIPQSKRGYWSLQRCHRRARRVVARTLETRTLQITFGLLAYVKTSLKSGEHNLPCRLKRIAVVVLAMLPVYTLLKVTCRIDLASRNRDAGWEPVRPKPAAEDPALPSPKTS